MSKTQKEHLTVILPPTSDLTRAIAAPNFSAIRNKGNFTKQPKGSNPLPQEFGTLQITKWVVSILLTNHVYSQTLPQRKQKPALTSKSLESKK